MSWQNYDAIILLYLNLSSLQAHLHWLLTIIKLTRMQTGLALNY